jgi:transposase
MSDTKDIPDEPLQVTPEERAEMVRCHVEQTTPGRPPRTTPEERAEMVRRYVEEGKPMRLIAEEMGRGYQTVWTAVTDAQVKKRGPGGSVTGAGTGAVMLWAERKRIVQLYNNGSSVGQIAAILKRGTRTILGVLEEEKDKTIPARRKRS